MIEAAYIKIENVYGIRELRIELNGAVTEITGGNGRGKSSVAAAIVALAEGGDPAKVIHKGAEKGRVRMGLSNGMAIERTFEDGKSPQLKLLDADGKKLDSPAARLKQMIDGLSFNPARFLKAESADQVRAFLEAIPMKLSAEFVDFLKVIPGIDVRRLQGVHALVALDYAHKVIYDARRDVNRDVERLNKSIETLFRNMPAAEQSDKAAAVDELRATVQQLANQRTEATSTAERVYIQEVREANGELDERVRAAEAVYRAAVMEAETVRRAAITAADQAKRDRCEKALNEKNAALGEFLANLDKDADDAKTRLAEAEAARDEVARAEGVRQTIEQSRSERDVLDDRGEQLTSVLMRIQKEKTRMLGRIPLKGVRFDAETGQLTDDKGVPFEVVNTAEKVRIALDLAELRAGEIPLILFDGFESLDPEALERFAAEAPARGLQYIVTRLTSGDLKVNGEAVYVRG